LVARSNRGIGKSGIASIYAATEPSFNIWVVVAVAGFGATMGDNIGYWLGSKYGYALLRHGERIGMFEARIKLGQYLFLRHGAKVVFLGRFVALLRILAAFLAGLNRMPWLTFLMANATGASSGPRRSVLVDLSLVRRCFKFTIACAYCVWARVGRLFWMWLLGSTVRRPAYNIGRTSLARTACDRAACEKAISV
jgi:hypothetical protein